MSKKLMLCLVIIGTIIIGMISTGIVQAAIEVDNTARLVYWSSVTQVFSYTFTDSARLIVLYGPVMYLAKNVRNDITGDSSAEKVPVGRGETITITLYSANDQPNADTSAWHVEIIDTFALLANVLPSGATASIGPDASDSFVYSAGSETATTSESYSLPDSIAYYTGATRAGGWTNGTWGSYQAYGSKNESGTPNDVQGIKWYWRYVECVRKYTPGVGIENWDGARYKLTVNFKLFKKDN